MHVSGEGLLVLALVLAVGGLDGELGGVDVGELGTVAVPTTGDLGLVVVVVGRGEEVAKDEFGDVDALLVVHLDGDTVAVVPDHDGVFLSVDIDLEVGHVGVAGLVVGSVDEDLVKDLVETGDVGCLAVGHLLLGLVVDPELLCMLLDTSDVGIGTLENVFELGELLVGLGGALGVGRLGRGRGLERDVSLAVHHADVVVAVGAIAVALCKRLLLWLGDAVGLGGGWLGGTIGSSLGFGGSRLGLCGRLLGGSWEREAVGGVGLVVGHLDCGGSEAAERGRRRERGEQRRDTRSSPRVYGAQRDGDARGSERESQAAPTPLPRRRVRLVVVVERSEAAPGSQELKGMVKVLCESRMPAAASGVTAAGPKMGRRDTRGGKEGGKVGGILRRWWDGRVGQARTTRGKSQVLGAPSRSGGTSVAATPQGAVTEGGTKCGSAAEREQHFFFFSFPHLLLLSPDRNRSCRELHKAYGSGRDPKTHRRASHGLSITALPFPHPNPLAGSIQNPFELNLLSG